MQVVLIGALLVTIAIRFAEPLQDGDLFWHMAYARQMLSQRTLILDHAAFSWTPAHTDILYCAWLSELLFYALWEYLGIISLFVFRYAIVLTIAGLAYAHARRLGLGRSVLTHLIVLILVLASYTGTIVKPEIFSLLGINVVVHLFFRAKQAAGESRQRSAASALYVIPLVLLVWVNSHGGFILAAPLLLAVVIGEGLNLVLSPALAFSRRLYIHLLGVCCMAAFATLVTPYGIAYPVQLFRDYVLGGRPRPDAAWNAAHRPIVAAIGTGFYFEELLVLMLALLLALTVLHIRRAPRGARIDWAMLLAILAYIPLYVVYLRSTFFLPAVFAYSALHQWYLVRSQRDDAVIPARFAPMLRECGVALCVFLAGRACVTAWYHPFYQSWLGFGVSYTNPVVEAEFLAQRHLGPRLYNIFDSGGYLLWRLDPTYKVMTDSRSFPYLDWFDEQYHFTIGDNFDTFTQTYIADTAVIDLMKPELVRRFVHAPEWQLAFYGPTAAVFVRHGATGASPAPAAADAVYHLRNAHTALAVFDFATSVDDFATAWAVLDQLERDLAYQADPQALQQAVAYRDAHAALRAGDVARARALFTRAWSGKQRSARDAAIAQLFDHLDATGAPATGADVASLQRLAAPGN